MDLFLFTYFNNFETSFIGQSIPDSGANFLFTTGWALKNNM